jgi:hypothetical protein
MNASLVTPDLDRTLATRREGSARRFWDRLRNAAAQIHLDRTEREVGRFLQENGGRLTDDIERRILDRISGVDRSGFH